MTAGKTAHKVLLTQQRAAHDLAEAGVSVSAPHDTTEVLKARYVFALLGFLGASILYFVRVNISVAIVAMVNHTALASARSPSEEASHDVCPGGDNDTLLKSEDGEFVWDEERQGLILSGFFYGYAAGQLVGGQLAERFGGKMVYGLGTFLAAALTVVSPQCAWLSHHLLFAVRLLEGLAESVTYPALQFMISKWAPPQERSRFSIIFSGGYLGTITCFPISGLLCDWGVAGGWPMVFYVFGGIGVVWFIPWLFLVYDSPQQHPRISPEERDYIEKSIGAIPSKKSLPTPWKALLLSPGVWACAVMYMGIGWTFFTLLTGLPTYMKHVLHFNIKNNAALSTIPYITGGVFSVILGYLMDYIIARGRVTKLTACKICNAITSIGPAVTLVLITLIGCDPVWIIVLLALNGLCMGTQYTGNSMNLIALAPNFAGTTYGLCNTFSSTVGILAPYVTGFLTNGNQTRTQWNVVFYTSAAVSMITFIFYMALCTDEEQPWNNPHPDMALEPMNKKPKSELDKMKSNESFSQLSLHLN
ncbi:sialin-like isoform X1 [Bacillus rossius redtenbacheri]|uniref:sialin-like isoform X1 n=1 Tax=Bacillus rossius redtenbacheri TaxID=93214 RepID=UPI002FDDDAA1